MENLSEAKNLEPKKLNNKSEFWQKTLINSVIKKIFSFKTLVSIFVMALIISNVILYNQVDDLSSQLNHLDTYYLESRISNIESEMDDTEIKLDDVESKVENTNSELDNLQSDINLLRLNYRY